MTLLSPRNLNVALILWIFFLLVLAIRQLDLGVKFDSDLRSLLPSSTHSTWQEQAEQQLDEFSQGRISLMLSSEDSILLKHEAELLQARLENARYWHFYDLTSQFSTSEWLAALQAHRFMLSADATLKELTDFSGQELEKAWHSLFSIVQDPRPMPFVEDPLNLSGRWLKQNSAFSSVVQEGVLLWHADRHAVLLVLQSSGAELNLSEQKNAVAEIDALLSGLPISIQSARAGLIFHAEQAATQAEKEVSIIASGSLVGIVLLFFWAFRSPWPLVISLLVVSLGIISAFVVTTAVFSTLHVMALVFGASLIGVAVDYCLHVFCHVYFSSGHPSENRKERSLKAVCAVRVGLLLALLTSCLAYLCLLQSPLPVLYQIAMFSIAGLFSSFLLALVVLPYLASFIQARKNQGLLYVAMLNVRPWSLWGRFQFRWGLVLVVALLLSSLLGLKFNSELSALHNIDSELLRQAVAIETEFKPSSANQYLLLEAQSEEALLELDRSVSKQLHDLMSDGYFESFLSVTQAYRLKTEQRSTYEVLNEKYYGNGAIERLLLNAGAAPLIVKEQMQGFNQAATKLFEFKQYLDLAPPQIKQLWLGESSGQWATLIVFSGLKDPAFIGPILSACDHCSWHDRVASMGEDLNTLTKQALFFLALAFVVAALFFVFLYRRWAILLLLGVPFISVITVLALLTLNGTAINLFHVMALYLVLGLGVDYAVFVYEANASIDTQHAYVAVFLSVITSCLSFGLMALSATPMVASFGLVILLGSLLNYCLSPLAQFARGRV
ncbi:MMPL family transporter [Agaribacterium sp. ZY112]|uniref:MMPL family transporter n=1 Tax=Agaribacterium sp. ZY112 TaxID=3233574 RepID=UPI0035252674